MNVRTYFRTVYFIITYLLCLFSISFGSSVISMEIKKDIITNLLGEFFICLGSFVISMFSWKLENQYFILYAIFLCKYDSFSIQSVIFTLLFIVMAFLSYRSYRIKFLIRFYFNFLPSQIEILYYIDYQSFTRFWVCIRSNNYWSFWIPINDYVLRLWHEN